MSFMISTNSKKITIEDVRGQVAKILSSDKVNNMAKIRAKCWLYHSESRHNNGNVPFTSITYNNHVGMQIYISYIEHDFINCDDIGGKQRAIEIVRKWYGY